MSASTSNKQIAINTLIVYTRILLSMVIGLFSSRYTLQLLGVSDYGLYNVVGGVVMMFSFITSSLSTGTVRFLNFEKGKIYGNNNKMFNICLILHVLFAIVLLLLLEIIGTIYILNYLQVIDGREYAAMVVFQLSVITACVGIINVPYLALFTVYEKFKYLAFVEILFSVFKLAAVIVLIYYPGDSLIAYAFAMSIITIIQSVLYIVTSKIKWPSITKFDIIKDKKEYKDVVSFNNYNMLGTLSLLLRSQGSNILINLFFGTAVNAAYAIGNTVLSYVNVFVGNFDSAASPQIIQNISAGNKDRYLYLVNFTCRICMLLMILIYFPLTCELGFVLNLWLGENVPEGAELFCHYTLLIAIVSSTSAGLFQLINGLGNLKWFTIQQFVLYIIAIFIGYFLYKINYPAYTILLLFVIADAVSRVVQLLLLKKMYGFDAKSFVKNVYKRPFTVFVIMCIYSYCYSCIGIDTIFGRVIGIFTTAIVSVILSFFIGLSYEDRTNIVIQIKNKIHSL